MSTTDHKKQISINRFYPYDIEDVWSAITDPEALSEWLMPTDFRLEPNHQFQFKTKPSGGFDGIVNCQIKSIQRPNFLSYSWNANTFKEPTTVEWHLKTIEDGTVVRLEHYGFKGFGGLIGRMILGYGWKRKVLKKLSNHLAK